MQKPVLVIMAAGMGSRFGGLKQVEPIDAYGNIIMDYSIYDAKNAGFEKVVFIIKKENLDIFKAKIGDRISRHMKVSYVFQELANIPAPFSLPEGRKKPWGTGHAILSCEHAIDGSFAVINADDYYGKEAFNRIYRFLINPDRKPSEYAMVGYLIENTITENGSVSRGVCELGENHMLKSVTERTHIEKKDGVPAFTEDGGISYKEIPAGTNVSMNFWGFDKGMIVELKKRFTRFMEINLPDNPLTSEYYLPSVVAELIGEGSAGVEVLPTSDKWFGITYQEDKKEITEAIQQLKNAGIYPQSLWEEKGKAT